MVKYWRVCVCVLGLISLSWLSGCGGSEKFPVAKVHGKVTYQGQPIKGGGTISFTPEGEGKAAGGMIAEDGTYYLSTYYDGDGALIGNHTVQIRQNLVLEEAVWPPVPEGQEPPKDFKPSKPEVRVEKADEIPAVYATMESPLKATVEKGGSELNFELQDQ